MVDYGRKLGRGDGQGLTSYEMWQVNRRKDEVQEIWRAYLEQQGVDAIVCPVAPWPSHPHGKGTTGVYTGIFNLLNYSAGVVPHSTVRPDDVFPANHKGRSKMEDTLVRRWDPNAWKDAPVCVQVVTGRLQEEKCLAAMRIVKEAIDAPTVRL